MNLFRGTTLPSVDLVLFSSPQTVAGDGWLGTSAQPVDAETGAVPAQG